MSPSVLVVRPSPVHGRGVFSTADFKAGVVILERDDSRLVADDNPLREGEHPYHCDWLPDGRIVYVQEPERYTNHSCDPNAYVKEIDGKRYCVARRDIRAGDEITSGSSAGSPLGWSAGSREISSSRSPRCGGRSCPT